jgi:hypothetical protein
MVGEVLCVLTPAHFYANESVDFGQIFVVEEAERRSLTLDGAGYNLSFAIHRGKRLNSIKVTFVI